MRLLLPTCAAAAQPGFAPAALARSLTHLPPPPEGAHTLIKQRAETQLRASLSSAPAALLCSKERAERIQELRWTHRSLPEHVKANLSPLEQQYFR